MDNTIIEPDEEETKEYQLGLAIHHLDEWMMDICSGDAVEDYDQVPLMQFIITMLSKLIPGWRAALFYQLRIETVGEEHAFIEMLKTNYGIEEGE